MAFNAHAWVGARRSTDLQKDSIQDQLNDCNNYAAQNSWKVDREWILGGDHVSGRAVELDSKFQEMVGLIETRRHGVQYLILYDVSRLGRFEPEDKIYWERHFKKHGVQIVYVHGDIKNNGNIADTVMKLFAHEGAYKYCENLSKDSRRGNESHFRRGLSPGGRPPYGFDRLLVDKQGKPLGILKKGETNFEDQDVKWVRGPAERCAVVTRMMNLYVSGNSPRTIADTFIAEGIPPSGKKPWSKGTIRSMLCNRAYIGVSEYGKRDYTGRILKKPMRYHPIDKILTREDPECAIVDRELFEKVQRIRESKMGPKKVGRRTDHPYLLTYLLTYRASAL